MKNEHRCLSCERFVGRTYYSSPEGIGYLHLRCMLRNAGLLKRSAIASLVVGTVLTLLNQGDFIFSGHFYGAMFWKVPFTFAVPFVVATWGAVMNCRRVEKS
tara:strand:+ start:308 stop:613 length:306 start_codon:yes stop_codon:yes gene_type:complete